MCKVQIVPNLSRDIIVGAGRYRGLSTRAQVALPFASSGQGSLALVIWSSVLKRPLNKTRSATLRADLHPVTRKPRVPGTPGLRRKESVFSLLTRHLFLIPALPGLGNVTGLLSVVPDGTGTWSVSGYCLPQSLNMYCTAEGGCHTSMLKNPALRRVPVIAMRPSKAYCEAGAIV